MNARPFVLDTISDRLRGGNPAPGVLLDAWTLRFRAGHAVLFCEGECRLP